MAAAPEPNRQMIGRYGGLKSWANTVDRSARTRPARRNSPGDIEYHLRRLGHEFDDATEAQRLAAADAAKRAYFAEMALKSAAARRRGVPHDAA